MHVYDRTFGSFMPHDKVEPHLDTIRYEIDKLELIVVDALRPLPKYRELLFIR